MRRKMCRASIHCSRVSCFNLPPTCYCSNHITLVNVDRSNILFTVKYSQSRSSTYCNFCFIGTFTLLHIILVCFSSIACCWCLQAEPDEWQNAIGGDLSAQHMWSSLHTERSGTIHTLQPKCCDGLTNKPLCNLALQVQTTHLVS